MAMGIDHRRLDGLARGDVQIFRLGFAEWHACSEGDAEDSPFPVP